jgi:Flp pilus assembly protein TadB
VARLASLSAWKLLVVLLALATAIALSIWMVVWVMWIIRPLLAVAAGLTAVVWTLRAVRRDRSSEELSANEWTGS